MTSIHHVSSSGAVLAVRIDGDADLPWLLLSNSLAADMSMWDDQIEPLTRLRRVIRYDTRGHGQSSAPEGPYGFGHLVGDMAAILDHFGIESADVLGLSLGGMTALGIGLEHPARVRKLICCSARAEFPPPAIAMWSDRIKMVREGGVSAVAEATLQRWFTEKAFDERPEIIERTRRMILSTSAIGYCGCASALQGLDYRRRLGGLHKPTLYVAGSNDMAAPPEVMQDMAQATPVAAFKIIPDAAHIANMENPVVFNSDIVDFLQDR